MHSSVCAAWTSTRPSAPRMLPSDSSRGASTLPLALPSVAVFTASWVAIVHFPRRAGQVVDAQTLTEPIRSNYRRFSHLGRGASLGVRTRDHANTLLDPELVNPGGKRESARQWNVRHLRLCPRHLLHAKSSVIPYGPVPASTRRHRELHVERRSASAFIAVRCLSIAQRSKRPLALFGFSPLKATSTEASVLFCSSISANAPRPSAPS